MVQFGGQFVSQVLDIPVNYVGELEVQCAICYWIVDLHLKLNQIWKA